MELGIYIKMARLNLTKRNKITIGVLIVFIGICLFSSTYFLTKKNQVFDRMNELYFELLVETELDELVGEEDEIIFNDDEPEISTKPAIDYTEYYVGYLSIPKLNLKKGFTDIGNRYNTVTRNIQVIKPSDYPDVDKGNFIIAAHSGSTSISFFRDLWKLEINDEAFVNYKGNDYQYIIKDIYTVPKTGMVTIKRNKEVSTLTLITCTRRDNTTQIVYILERV